MEYVVGFLGRYAQRSSGDLETMLVYMTVAVATEGPRLRGQAGRGEALSRAAIARRLGLPRETVRRKINDLVAAGWLTDDDGRGLALASDLTDAAADQAAADNLADLRQLHDDLKRLAGLDLAAAKD